MSWEFQAILRGYKTEVCPSTRAEIRFRFRGQSDRHGATSVLPDATAWDRTPLKGLAVPHSETPHDADSVVHAAIVNTSSVLGIIGGGGAAAYHASKGAVRLLSKTAAVEYATHGVRVNSIHPGVIATPMIQEILDQEGDQQRDIARTPMKRAGTASEIAAGILFLASADSSFVTGAELVVDGG